MLVKETSSLDSILSEFENSKNMDLTVKSSSSKMKKYHIKSPDRESARSEVENILSSNKIGRVSRKLLSDSSMEATLCMMRDGTKLTFVYKPIRGGMSQTTLNSSITELFPCIAFLTGIKPQGTTKDFYNKILNNNSSSLSCYLDPKDAQAGQEFIDKAETGKFNEKVQNAMNILKWIRAVNKMHPISNVYWGYRKKPKGVMKNHPGDIFLEFSNGNLLGVSLKAGGEKTNEPKLNTYVRPIYEYFGKLNEYEKIKDKLWPQYMKIPGITQADKSSWGTRALAIKTYEYEKTNQQEYNELYDQNLAIIKQELINLINSDFKKAKNWIKNQVANQQQEIPVVVVKSTLSTARRDKSNNILNEALAAVSSIQAAVSSTKSKQAFNIFLADGSQVQLDFTTRTNKVGASHKLGQFSNLAVKFNKVQ